MFPDLHHFTGALLALRIADGGSGCRSRGRSLKLTPSLAAKEEYNDNIFLATGNRR